MTFCALVALQLAAFVTVTEYVPAAFTVMLCVVSPPGLHTLPVVLLLVKVMLAPAQKLLGPVIVGVAGSASMVTTLFTLVALQFAAFVTVTEYVPAAFTVMLCVVCPPGLHTLPVALLLVKVMLAPVQKLFGPVIVGEAGNASMVTTLFTLVALQLDVFVTVTE